MAIRQATWPSGTRIVFKDLSWKDYKNITSSRKSPIECSSEVYNICIVQGPPLDKVPAGVMTWLYQQEVENSVFSGDYKIISKALPEYRSNLSNNYLMAAQCLIAAVFRIPFSEMDGWSEDLLLHRLAQAEFISGKPFDPVDPEAPKGKTNKPGNQFHWTKNDLRNRQSQS